MEVISLDPELPACPKPADLPEPTKGMVAAAMQSRGGAVAACGGHHKYLPTSNCYEYIRGSWRRAAYDMTEKREAAAAVVLPKNNTWLVTGGMFFARGFFLQIRMTCTLQVCARRTPLRSSRGACSARAT